MLISVYKLGTRNVWPVRLTGSMQDQEDLAFRRILGATKTFGDVSDGAIAHDNLFLHPPLLSLSLFPPSTQQFSTQLTSCFLMANVSFVLVRERETESSSKW